MSVRAASRSASAPSSTPTASAPATRAGTTTCAARRFLATDQWPVITFEASYIRPTQTARTVSGTLTVKDTQCPVRLDVASFAIPADGQAAQVDLRATGRLDRRSAGVTAGPAFLIGHLISLSLAVRLRRQAGPPQR